MAQADLAVGRNCTLSRRVEKRCTDGASLYDCHMLSEFAAFEMRVCLLI